MACLMENVGNCCSSIYMCAKFSKKKWLALTGPTYQALPCVVSSIYKPELSCKVEANRIYIKN